MSRPDTAADGARRRAVVGRAAARSPAFSADSTPAATGSAPPPTGSGAPLSDRVSPAAVGAWLALLPDAPYRPGRTARPAAGFLDAVVDAAPAATAADTWRENAAYLFGFACLVRGYYWEAHEVWEPVWMRAAPNSRERHLLRGLIQLANALLKNAVERPNAAARLRLEADAALAEAAGGDPGAVVMGVAPNLLRARIARITAADAGDGRPETDRGLFEGMSIEQYIAQV